MVKNPYESHKKPSSTSQIRVRYAETDQMGVVYHANYFVWFEVGRCDLLRTLGLSYRDVEKDGISLPVISASCEYQHPIRYDDHITVVTRGTIISPVRLEFEYNIIGRDDHKLLAVGRTAHAAVNSSGHPRRLPNQLLTLLT